MTGFTYIWTHKENGRYYIGGHGGSLDDGYITSQKAFRKAYDSEPHMWDRTIEYIGPGYAQEEADLLKFFDVKRCELAYNKSDRAVGHTRTGEKRKPHSEETKAKMREAKLGKKRKPFSDETRARMSATRRGRTQSPEWVTKRLASMGYKTRKRKAETSPSEI